MHEGICYNCDQCYYKAKDKRKLKQHVESQHEGVRYKAKRKDKLKQHLESEHKGVIFSCNKCSFNVKRKEKLQ